MARHYILWATGQDKPGIVAGVTAVLFKNGCNLEDSSMMRLGSEFGILSIFTTKKRLTAAAVKKMFQGLENRFALTVGVKGITPAQAAFTAIRGKLLSISVHGFDRPGIVYHVTQLLARHRFNITDLSTHRTTTGRAAGFILFIEGEVRRSRIASLERNLRRLQRRLKNKITLHEITPRSL